MTNNAEMTHAAAEAAKTRAAFQRCIALAGTLRADGAHADADAVALIADRFNELLAGASAAVDCYDAAPCRLPGAIDTLRETLAVCSED